MFTIAFYNVLSCFILPKVPRGAHYVNIYVRLVMELSVCPIKHPASQKRQGDVIYVTGTWNRFQPRIYWIYIFSNNSRPEPVFVNVYGAKESIPWNSICSLAGRYYNSVVVLAWQAGNRFIVSLKGLQIRALFSQASAGILEGWNRVGKGWVVVLALQSPYCKLSGSPGIDSLSVESIPRNRYLGYINTYKYGLRQKH